MFFITPILAGIILVGTLGAGTYVTGQAREVVSQYNLSQVAYVLEIYYAQDGKYPESLDEVIKRGEVKNINVGDYKYTISSDLNKYTISNNDFCLRQIDMKVISMSRTLECGVDFRVLR